MISTCKGSAIYQLQNVNRPLEILTWDAHTQRGADGVISLLNPTIKQTTQESFFDTMKQKLTSCG